MDLGALFVGVFEIYGVHFQQREIALTIFGTSDLTLDGVAGAKTEAPDLTWADIDIVGPGQIVRVGRAQEAEAVLQHLDDAGPGDFDLARRVVRIAK
jgi:hypothetical protein